MFEWLHRYGARVKRALDAQSPEDREKRAEDLFALSLVAAAAIAKYVTGLTLHDAPFTLYALAVAGSAALGGMRSALIATLGALVAGGLTGPGGVAMRVSFLVEALSVASLVAFARSAVRAAEARVTRAEEQASELTLCDCRGRTLDAALQHLEDAAADTAVVVLNATGMVTEWRPGAERVFGHPAGDPIGSPVASLFHEMVSPLETREMLDEAERTGLLRRPAVMCGPGGLPVSVDLEVRPFRTLYGRGFTLTAHDTALRREWDDYRLAASRAQTALQRTVDEAKQRLAALEALTDPALNPFEGDAAATELLERLRQAVRADGVALARPGADSGSVVAARGLQPAAGSARGEGVRLTPGRVEMVHNDPARVEQLSALGWSEQVVSLLAVPVVHDGEVRSTIEVVSQRSRQVSDWDVALARVVADRLAAVAVRPGQAPARPF
jgi:PAS domain-containing protein